jgi:hypothetical protein
MPTPRFDVQRPDLLNPIAATGVFVRADKGKCSIPNFPQIYQLSQVVNFGADAIRDDLLEHAQPYHRSRAAEGRVTIR